MGIILWILKTAGQTTNSLTDKMGSVGNVSRHEGGANPFPDDAIEIDNQPGMGVVAWDLPLPCSSVVYQGKGKEVVFRSELPMPNVREPTDVIIKVHKTTISPDDLASLSRNRKVFQNQRRLGQECIGEITEVGKAVSKRKIGQRVLVSSVTSCGHCASCKSRLYGECEDGGMVDWSQN
eukprot:TRINITY_DN29135_c0_g1_i1.p1 TRINITY_DN29135_c0_g1~~TRINITY_DN29135_c0_g1_i1.p1  ORF type:complete len:202 (+),score=66.14 TRINITY_DN29135_c0_g1_i1:71-607(+)